MRGRFERIWLEDGKYIFEIAAVILIPLTLLALVFFPLVCLRLGLFLLVVVGGVRAVWWFLDFLIADYERDRFKRLLTHLETVAFDTRVLHLRNLSEDTHKRISDIMEI